MRSRAIPCDHVSTQEAPKKYPIVDAAPQAWPTDSNGGDEFTVRGFTASGGIGTVWKHLTRLTRLTRTFELELVKLVW